MSTADLCRMKLFNEVEPFSVEGIYVQLLADPLILEWPEAGCEYCYGMGKHRELFISKRIRIRIPAPVLSDNTAAVQDRFWAII